MVAKTAGVVERRMAGEKRVAAALDPDLVHETLKKVDKCMARLQELQFTVAGGAKQVAGVNLSPRSTRGYLRTSLRCKQEFLRVKNAAGSRKSPTAKVQGSTNGEWKRMSLPAALLGETVVEILQASKVAKELAVAAATAKATASFFPRSRISSAAIGPKTPDAGLQSKSSSHNARRENSDLKIRRTKEIQRLQRSRRTECSYSPAISRARSRIVFKPAVTPIGVKTKSKLPVAANRVSPKNRPWAKKTVLFPNPIFRSTASSPPSASRRQQNFYKTRSPIIAAKTALPQKTTTIPQPPHKFAIRSPSSSSSLRSHFRSGMAVALTADDPSPSPGAKRRLRRCSFSPSKLAAKLFSPLKKKTTGNNHNNPKQRPSFIVTPVRLAFTKRIIGAPSVQN